MGNIKKKENETFQEFCHRVSSYKNAAGYTWDQIADIINENCNCQYSGDKYRKQEKKYQRSCNDEYILENEELEELVKEKIERVKVSDEKTAVNAMYRRISREETLKQIAKEAAESLKDIKLEYHVSAFKKKSKKSAILVISDWHYGLIIDSYFNQYNPEIAKERIEKLIEEVLDELWLRDIHDLYVVNLGDLICGNIHLQLRLNSRIDVITQIMQASELVAQMLAALSQVASIHYCDTLDNHSRIEPKIKDSLELESLARLTKWYLKERLPEVDYIDNTFGDDIVDFEVCGHKVIGVHGHKDKPSKVIDNLSLLTHQHYDLVLTAHLHHFSAEEKNETLCISNSSLMGTDQFAQDLRLNSDPSQNLIIVSEDNVAKEIIRILV